MTKHASKADLLKAIRHPAHPPFRVTYEFYPNSTVWTRFANIEKDNEYYRNLSQDSDLYPLRDKLIADNNKDAQNLNEYLFNTQDNDQIVYEKLKKYYEEKIKELKLDNPLVFFDDNAFRVDTGYGPKEMQALFPDNPIHYKFIEQYLARDYSIFLTTEKKRIKDAATIAFAEILPLKPQFTLPEACSEEVLLQNCLTYSRGIVIAEGHTQVSSKEFLITHMPLLKQKGVTTLYMEHLLHERHQALLDQYMQSPTGSAMPRELELYLAFLDKGFKLEGETGTFTHIVKAAKTAGVRIIAIDTEVTYGEKIRRFRLQLMNMVMLERYQHYDDKKGYAVFTGSSHSGFTLGVPGVSDLLGCVSLGVFGLDNHDKQERILANGSIDGDYIMTADGNAMTKEKIEFDFLCYRPITAKPTVAMVTQSNSSNQASSYTWPMNAYETHLTNASSSNSQMDGQINIDATNQVNLQSGTNSSCSNAMTSSL